MSRPRTKPASPVNQPQMLSLRDVCEVLVRHFGHTEGVWDISVELNFAVGAVGPSPETTLPGAMMGVSRIGITPARGPGPNTVDASKLTSEGA